jgi:hypothetical protein
MAPADGSLSKTVSSHWSTCRRLRPRRWRSGSIRMIRRVSTWLGRTNSRIASPSGPSSSEAWMSPSISSSPHDAGESAPAGQAGDPALHQLPHLVPLAGRCPRVRLQPFDAEGNSLALPVHREHDDFHFLPDVQEFPGGALSVPRRFRRGGPGRPLPRCPQRRRRGSGCSPVPGGLRPPGGNSGCPPASAPDVAPPPAVPTG